MRWQFQGILRRTMSTNYYNINYYQYINSITQHTGGVKNSDYIFVNQFRRRSFQPNTPHNSSHCMMVNIAVVCQFNMMCDDNQRPTKMDAWKHVCVHAVKKVLTPGQRNAKNSIGYKLNNIYNTSYRMLTYIHFCITILE